MSRIDDLMADLCPLGVRFSRLGDVVRIRNGKDHKALGEGEIPVYGSGGVMRYADTAIYRRPSVLIPRKGSLGNLFFVDVPFWTVDTIFYTEIDELQILPKFFYHFLTTVGLGGMNQAGGVPSQTQAVLKELRIPVPPLEVQQEIVRILDQFTQLEAELEAELEARRRQYEHYRDSLLSFSERERERERGTVPMSEVGRFIRGRRFTKADVVVAGLGAMQFGDVHAAASSSTRVPPTQVRPDLASQLRYAQTNDVVIAGVSETVEDIGKAVAWLGDGPLAFHDDCFVFRSEVNGAYVSYFMQTKAFHDQKGKYVSRAKVKRISAEGLGKILMPVPPAAEQARIVEHLDAFDTLVNDLSSGLPAEIAARWKQYEYYRDKLLTFDEVGV